MWLINSSDLRKGAGLFHVVLLLSIHFHGVPADKRDNVNSGSGNQTDEGECTVNGCWSPACQGDVCNFENYQKCFETLLGKVFKEVKHEFKPHTAPLNTVGHFKQSMDVLLSSLSLAKTYAAHISGDAGPILDDLKNKLIDKLDDYLKPVEQSSVPDLIAKLQSKGQNIYDKYIIKKRDSPTADQSHLQSELERYPEISPTNQSTFNGGTVLSILEGGSFPGMNALTPFWKYVFAHSPPPDKVDTSLVDIARHSFSDALQHDLLRKQNHTMDFGATMFLTTALVLSTPPVFIMFLVMAIGINRRWEILCLSSETTDNAWCRMQQIWIDIFGKSFAFVNLEHYEDKIKLAKARTNTKTANNSE